MKQYEIINVTDHYDNVKPQRIGRIIAPIESGDPLAVLTKDKSQVFYYVDGAGAFITSPLISIMGDDKRTVMKTRNSIYTLRRVK